MLVADATASLDMMLLAVHSSLLQLTRIVQRQSVDFTALARRVLTQAEQSNATSAKQWASSNANFVSSNPAACAARCDAANYFASSYKSFSAARPGSRTKQTGADEEMTVSKPSDGHEWRFPAGISCKSEKCC
jgi:hypothetical protein